MSFTSQSLHSTAEQGKSYRSSRRLIRFHNLTIESAVEIVSVASESPAQRAGMRPGDLIVAINMQEVRSVDLLHRFLAEWPMGEPVEITIIRGQERLELEVIPIDPGGAG